MLLQGGHLCNNKAIVRPAETAEPIEVPYGMVGPRNHEFVDHESGFYEFQFYFFNSRILLNFKNAD